MLTANFKTTYGVFMDFVVYLPSGEVKTERILSKECYNTWLKSRKYRSKKPWECYRDAIIGHIRGKNGRRPFPKDVERSLLKNLRRKETWKCFKGRANIGCCGFRGFGYHELQDAIDLDSIFFETLAQFMEDKNV